MVRQKIKRFMAACVLAVLFTGLCGFSSDTQRLYDYDDLYSDEEEQQLEELLYETSEDLKCELAIVTVEDYDGKNSMAYADDFYDEHEFGAEVDYTGFLLLVNMHERELYISNAGEAPDYFTDDMIDKMVASIGNYLADEDYMGAATWYVDYIEDEMWETNYNEGSFKGIMSQWWAQLLVAVVVAAIIVLCLAHKNKTKMTANAYTYLKDQKGNILQSSDHYIRTSTVSHKIESSSSGGGGSTHKSSSGRSHGGGGGKF